MSEYKRNDKVLVRFFDGDVIGRVKGIEPGNLIIYFPKYDETTWIPYKMIERKLTDKEFYIMEVLEKL